MLEESVEVLIEESKCVYFLKGETEMDAKKLEKEADILRTKIQAMEDENERLCDENKKLQLRVVKRLPLSANESSYIERQVGSLLGMGSTGTVQGGSKEFRRWKTFLFKMDRT